MGIRGTALLLAGFLFASVTVAPTAGAGPVVVRDAVGDVQFPGGDLRSAGVVYEHGTVLLSATTAAPTISPFADGPWADPATGISWFLSGPGGDDLFRVTLRSEHTSTYVSVRADAVRLADGAATCSGLVDMRWGAYTATFPASCLGGFDRFRAEMTYKDGATTTHDVAPDAGSSDVVADPAGPAGSNPSPVVPADVRSGYWVLTDNGAVTPFGDVRPLGDLSSYLAPVSPRFERAVDIDVSPHGLGYWILTDRGHAYNCFTTWGCGAPPWLNAKPIEPNPPLFAPATSISVTPSGNGLWVFSEKGSAIPFGDAQRYGELWGTNLNAPIVDSVATPSGHGYYMVAADGGVFSFGDAHFAGSMGDKKLNAPVKAIVPDGDGSGYWLVAADGGIFAFDAPFKGSMGNAKLNKPVRGMIRYGDGYLMVAEDGGIFNFSAEPFAGSLGATPPASPVVSVASLNL